MDITLDRQVLSDHCAGCNVDFVVIRGSVFDGGRPIGLYLIALHGHSPSGQLAHLALAFVNDDGASPPSAAALDVLAMPDHVGYSVVDWSDSPWKNDTYLGVMLDREAVLASPIKDAVFHVAGHVTSDIPEVHDYFA